MVIACEHDNAASFATCSLSDLRKPQSKNEMKIPAELLDPRANMRDLRRSLTILVLYFSLWHFAAIMNVATDASAFYPACGVLMFFFYHWGWRCWPAAVLAMVLVDVSQYHSLIRQTSNDLHLLRQLLVYGGLAMLTQRRNWLNLSAHSLPATIRLVFLSLGASLLSAMLAIGIFWFFLPELRGAIRGIFFGFWIGDFTGLLMFLGAAKIIMIWHKQRRVSQMQSNGYTIAGLIGLCAMAIGVVVLVVILTANGLMQTYSYLVLLPVIIGATAYGLGFGVIASILTNLSAVGTYILSGSQQMDPVQLQMLCAVVMTVGMMLGAAVDDRRLAQFEAWHDPLTGVLNRRAFFDQGHMLLARANRHGFNIALIMLDLDHFKLVNDRYGHDAGDRLLRSVAQCCTAVTRRGDLCARLGGEEFVLLLEDTDPADATGVAERVRQMISTLKRGESEDAVTASFGVSMLVGAIKTLDELLHDADRLLYMAKNTGRNRVVMNDHPSPPSAAQTSAAAVVG